MLAQAPSLEVGCEGSVLAQQVVLFQVTAQLVVGDLEQLGRFALIVFGFHQRLFDQIEVLMTDYVAQAIGVDRAEADRDLAQSRRSYAEVKSPATGVVLTRYVTPGSFVSAATSRKCW